MLILQQPSPGPAVWFKEVAKICDDLGALVEEYEDPIQAQANKTGVDPDQRRSLKELLNILNKHEGDLKRDIRNSASLLGNEIAANRIGNARSHAKALREEIGDQLAKTHCAALDHWFEPAWSIRDLDREQVAEEALRTPQRVLLFNMAMVLLLFILGAAVMQYITLLQFPLLTGFVLTTIVVLNAFYLRSIDKLKDKSFLELMKLALLKFFAPLARRPSTAPPAGTQ